MRFMHSCRLFVLACHPAFTYFSHICGFTYTFVAHFRSCGFPIEYVQGYVDRRVAQPFGVVSRPGSHPHPDYELMLKRKVT